MNGDDRRRADTECLAEMRLLRSEFSVLRDKQRAYERQQYIRDEKMDEQINELRRKFAGAKGVFYGFGIGFSALYYLIADRLKDLFK